MNKSFIIITINYINTLIFYFIYESSFAITTFVSYEEIFVIILLITPLVFIYDLFNLYRKFKKNKGNESKQIKLIFISILQGILTFLFALFSIIIFFNFASETNYIRTHIDYTYNITISNNSNTDYNYSFPSFVLNKDTLNNSDTLSSIDNANTFLETYPNYYYIEVLSAEKDHDNLLVTFSFTNNTDNSIEYEYSCVNEVSRRKNESREYDDLNYLDDIDYSPARTVLPGETIEYSLNFEYVYGPGNYAFTFF